MLKKHHKPTDCTNYYTANNLSNTQSQNKTLYIHNTLNCIRALGVCWGILWNNPLIDLDFFFLLLLPHYYQMHQILIPTEYQKYF